MLTFNLKKEWFEKIKSGEKTHEYVNQENFINQLEIIGNIYENSGLLEGSE